MYKTISDLSSYYNNIEPCILFAICNNYMFIKNDIGNTYAKNNVYSYLNHINKYQSSIDIIQTHKLNISHNFKKYDMCLLYHVITILKQNYHSRALLIACDIDMFKDINNLVNIDILLNNNNAICDDAMHEQIKYIRDQKYVYISTKNKNTRYFTKNNSYRKYDTIIIDNNNILIREQYLNISHHMEVSMILQSIYTSFKMLYNKGNLIINFPIYSTVDDNALNDILYILTEVFEHVDIVNNDYVNAGINMRCIILCTNFSKIYQIYDNIISNIVNDNRLTTYTICDCINADVYKFTVLSNMNIRKIKSTEYTNLITKIQYQYSNTICEIEYVYQLCKCNTNEIHTLIKTRNRNMLCAIMKFLNKYGILVLNLCSFDQISVCKQLLGSIYNFRGIYAKIMPSNNIQWNRIHINNASQVTCGYINISDSFYRLSTLKDAFYKLTNKYESEYIQHISYVTCSIAKSLSKCVNKYLKYRLNFAPTNAFMKLYELLHVYDLLPSSREINTFHIAEAPGQFIITIEYYIKTRLNRDCKYNWLANSLNPENDDNIRKFGKGILEDYYGLLKNHKDKWLYGTGTGDITQSSTIKHIASELSNYYPDLITGDAGLCTDETSLYTLQKLDYAQCVFTLMVAKRGSNAIIKHFLPHIVTKSNSISAGTFFVNMIYLYWLSFDEIYLTKPTTSNYRSGEFYIVCKNFKHIDRHNLCTMLDNLDNFRENMVLFDKDMVDIEFIELVESFINDIIEIITRTKNVGYLLTRCAIDKFDDVNNINKTSALHQREYNKIRNRLCELWIHNYNFNIDNTAVNF
jgi:hypothetical protein